MSFWSSNKLEDEHSITPLIFPFNKLFIQQGAYELRMGPEGAISQDGSNKRHLLEDGESFCIPRGQFGLLLTEEVVSIPANAIAFISLKTRIKSSGLVNVSGFHVDPGYSGRIKFWVFNAGNQDIYISRGDPTFLIWFADLDQPTRDPYSKNSETQNRITSENLQKLQGHLASPAALAKQMEALEQKIHHLEKETDHKIHRFEFLNNTFFAIVVGIALIMLTPLYERVWEWILPEKPTTSEKREVIIVRDVDMKQAPALPPTSPEIPKKTK